MRRETKLTIEDRIMGTVIVLSIVANMILIAYGL